MPDKNQTRRYKILAVDDRVLIAMLEKAWLIRGLPSDACVLRATTNESRMAIEFLVSSESFDDIPPNQWPPYFQSVLYSDHVDLKDEHGKDMTAYGWQERTERLDDEGPAFDGALPVPHVSPTTGPVGVDMAWLAPCCVLCCDYVWREGRWYLPGVSGSYYRVLWPYRIQTGHKLIEACPQCKERGIQLALKTIEAKGVDADAQY